MREKKMLKLYITEFLQTFSSFDIGDIDSGGGMDGLSSVSYQVSTRFFGKARKVFLFFKFYQLTVQFTHCYSLQLLTQLALVQIAIASCTQLSFHISADNGGGGVKKH